MLDPQNLVTISGGLIAEPELVANGRIAKIRLAVDYAGSEKDSDNNSGYFDITYFLKDNNGFTSKNASFVANQIEASKMKKGTTVSVIGRLLQERWKQDETSRNRVVIIAEHMTYGQRSNSSPKTDQASTETAQSNTSVPNSF